MKKFYWLLKREFWEHKTLLLWLPLAAGAFSNVILSGYVWAKLLKPPEQRTLFWFGLKIGEPVNEAALQKSTGWIAGASFIDALFIFTAVGVGVFFYASNTIFDEKQNRSILFWQSLPTSDFMVIASKLTTGLVIAPLVGIFISILYAILTCSLFSLLAAKHGLDIFSRLATHPLFYRQLFDFLAMLPLYALWALPTASWLILVSACARSKPALWAAGIPTLLTGATMLASRALTAGQDGVWAFDSILGRILGSVIPGAWMRFGAPKFEIERLAATSDLVWWNALPHALQLATAANFWIGVALGLVLIYAAVQLRKSQFD